MGPIDYEIPTWYVNQIGQRRINGQKKPLQIKIPSILLQMSLIGLEKINTKMKLKIMESKLG